VKHWKKWAQGDQIGQIFADWAIVFFWQLCFKLQKLPKLILQLFSAEKNMYLFWQETGWATLWVIFNRLIRSPCSSKESQSIRTRI
jgi:hypothetical protein